MTSSKLMNYITREFVSDNELGLYFTKQDEILLLKLLKSLKKL
jgi:hypothetical protein